MSGRRARGGFVPLPAPLPPETFAEGTARHIAEQAREAIKAGMGMEAFFRWGLDYAVDVRGHTIEEAEGFVLTAHEVARQEAREIEIWEG